MNQKIKGALCGVIALTIWISQLSGSDLKQPNIVLIIADDCTFSDLPLYGGINVKTPRIDQLGGQSLVFNKAYVSMAMCVPCRSSIYTGLYPFRNGCAWNHAPTRAEVESMPHYLGRAGYRVGIAGKVHVQPKSVYPFEWVDGVERNPVAETADFNPAPLSEFMKRDDEQPFALVIGFNSPHAPWSVGDPDHFDPATFVIPDNLPDTPEVREALCRYYAEIEVLDQQVGGVLDALETAGKAHNTLVMFTSEQGAQFPGCKWTNWDAGVHTGMTVRWPGKVNPGRTDALVQYCDVLPTLLEAAGVGSGENKFDGSSFLSVLTGQSTTHREYAYFVHNNIPEGPSYPIRGVTDGRFHYIRNLTPDEIYIEKHLFGKSAHNPYVASIFWTSPDDRRSYDLMKRYMRRPAEELYDNREDRYQLQNLANDGHYLPQLEQLSAQLTLWLKTQGDPGAKMDTWAAFQTAHQPRTQAEK